MGIIMCCISALGQNTVYAEKKLNDDSINVQVITQDGQKYWNVTNLLCKKIVVGQTSKEYYDEKSNGIAPLTKGDTLTKGQSKIFAIDYFSKDDPGKFPYFLLKWQEFTNKEVDRFVHFCNSQCAVNGIIVAF